MAPCWKALIPAAIPAPRPRLLPAPIASVPAAQRCILLDALSPAPQQSRAVSSAWLPCLNMPFMEKSRLGEDSSQLLWLPGHLTGAGCWSQLPALSPAARGAHRAVAHPLQCCFSASLHHKTVVPVASRRL